MTWCLFRRWAGRANRHPLRDHQLTVIQDTLEISQRERNGTLRHYAGALGVTVSSRTGHSQTATAEQKQNSATAVTGKRPGRERDVLITSHDASPAVVTLPNAWPN